MDQDFLKREEEFQKENKLLELKTKELLQQVDDMKKMQDLQFLDFKPAMKRIEAKDLHLPKSVDEMGTKGMIHFYKSKIKALQEELEKNQTELKNKNEELKKIQKNYQTVSEEKEKWFLQYNVEKNANTKLEKQISACNSKLQLKDNENISLKKEVEQLKTEFKNCSNELSASEGRLKRALQEVEKQKTSLKNLRQEEKVRLSKHQVREETKEEYRNNLKDLNATVKQIQKHKNELLQGYKKQIQLIDNLKKQKANVESCKVLELAESEFFKLLDWKMD